MPTIVYDAIDRQMILLEQLALKTNDRPKAVCHLQYEKILLKTQPVPFPAAPSNQNS
jgi:hypothetical protein